MYILCLAVYHLCIYFVYWNLCQNLVYNNYFDVIYSNSFSMLYSTLNEEAKKSYACNNILSIPRYLNNRMLMIFK